MRDRPARRLLLAAALASALVAVAVTSAANGASGHSGRRAEAGSILVGFHTGVSPSAQADVLADADAKPIKRFASIHGALVSVAPGTTAQTIETLNRDPRVAYAEPNFILHAADVIPNDPFFPRLWGLHNTGQTVNWTAGTPDADIDAPEAWSVSTGSPDVVVAVIDTGVDTAHPDLAPNIWVNAGEDCRGAGRTASTTTATATSTTGAAGTSRTATTTPPTTTGTARTSRALLPHPATTVSASPA